MLIRFSLKNSRSFAEQSELSLVKSNLRGPEVPTKLVPQMSETAVLPCALIYGSNASGKSNLLRGINFFKSAIKSSHNKGAPKGGVPRQAFSLREKCDEPSRFEADFVAENVRYTFGFTCNDDCFLEEWLFSYPEGKRRILYTRSGEDVDFGGKFTGSKKQLVEFMRPNSLFISTATQNDHPQLSKIVNYISSWSAFLSTSVSSPEIYNKFKGREIDPRIIKFLGLVGTGVVDAKSEAHEIPKELQGLGREFAEILRARLGDEIAPSEIEEDELRYSVKLGHRGSGEGVFYLSLDRESSGTRRLILLMAKVFEALDSGSVLLVDELDASLHTLAAEEVVKLFQTKETNPLGAQLIATTHDTNLLAAESLRRDQIWFCQRELDGGSELFSLAEIKSRPSDNFEKGYLEGRYGAIPYAGDIRLLFERQE